MGPVGVYTPAGSEFGAVRILWILASGRLQELSTSRTTHAHAHAKGPETGGKGV
eukprot:COSAG02_NODE_3313_length_6953_cov_95.249635_3_plen_54_part_00